jgi:hypothetical protein
MAGTTTDVYKVRAVLSDAFKEASNVKYEGFTLGGRAYGIPIYILGIEKGAVKIVSVSLYPKELAAQGEK